MAQNPTLGRIVHYTFPDGEVRPAVVVRDWGGGCVNLQVFLDGDNDARKERPSWATSVAPSDAVPTGEGEAAPPGEPGTASQAGRWNWPARS